MLDVSFESETNLDEDGGYRPEADTGFDMKAQSLALLENNADLLSTDKQAIARWLCEVWASAPSPAPKWLRHKYWTTFSFPLHTDDAPEKMLRELSLELLKKHKAEIARRAKIAR